MQTLDLGGGELNGASDGVDQPPEHHLGRFEGAVPLPELLDADWVLPELVVLGIGRAKHHINAVEENAAESASALLAVLGHENEVVHEDVRLPDWAFAVVLDAGRLTFRGRRAAQRGGRIRNLILAMGRRLPVLGDLSVGDVGH